ncbi:hypothetical protein CF326_g6114 [Tilletia indica]|nr:hypothetical protein CF326_g6114 [Tilletia indica]
MNWHSLFASFHRDPTVWLMTAPGAPQGPLPSAASLSLPPAHSTASANPINDARPPANPPTMAQGFRNIIARRRSRVTTIHPALPPTPGPASTMAQGYHSFTARLHPPPLFVSPPGTNRRLKKQHDSDEKTRTVTGGEAHAHTLSAGAIIRRTVTTSVSAVLTKSTVDIIAFAFAQVPAPVRQDKNPAKSFASNVKTRNTKETLSGSRHQANLAREDGDGCEEHSHFSSRCAKTTVSQLTHKVKVSSIGKPFSSSHRHQTADGVLLLFLPSRHSKTRRTGGYVAEEVVGIAIEYLVYPTYDTKGRLDTAVDNFIEWLTGKIQTDLFSNQTPKKPSQLLKKAEEAVQAPSKS